jgi:hypothetical protein
MDYSSDRLIYSWLRGALRSFLLATLLILGVHTIAEADQLPKQFLGVWMLNNSENKKLTCTKKDWISDTDSDPSVYLFESNHLTGREYGCKLLSVRPNKNLPGAIVAQFKCGGEGEDWEERQVLSIHEIFGKQLLVQATTFAHMTRQEGKQNIPKPIPTNMQDESIEVYQECP